MNNNGYTIDELFASISKERMKLAFIEMIQEFEKIPDEYESKAETLIMLCMKILEHGIDFYVHKGQECKNDH